MCNVDEKRIILRMLAGSSEDGPILAKDISINLGFKESSSYPRTRKIITEMIDDGVPIGGNGKGIYLIRTEKELQKYLNKLTSRMIGYAGRIKAVYTAFHGK